MMRIISCIAAITICTCALAQETRMYECQRAAQRPAIDGKLDDACWQSAPKTGQFTRVMKGPDEIQQTVFQAVYDDANLYIGVTCFEPQPGNIAATITTRDVSAVMGDDAIEIFLQPDAPDGTYYQLSANSIGTRYDGLAYEPGWNAQWTAAGSVGESAWFLECAISFGSFDAFGAPGATWGFNIGRDRNAGGQTEWSAWSDTMGAFHTPERFGRLIFAGDVAGINRSLLIESAAYARRTIALQETIVTGLTELEGGVELLPEKDRAEVEPTVARAKAALVALNEFLAEDRTLDLDGWMQVTKLLQASADEMERTAWVIRFGRLLAD